MALNREAVIRSAEKYVSKGKLENAIKEYRKVLGENPNDINTLNRVGDLYARLERYDEAVRLFSQIAEQYTRDGFFVKAIAIYKKIIKLDPTALTVYERLAELYHKQGLLNEARTQYQVLADYYQKHDNATSAITIYQRMSEIEPENPTFHLKLAELYESQRLVDKAIREYRQLADLMIVNGSVDEAVQVYLKALEIGSDNLVFVREAVGGLHEGGHTAAAAKVLAKAVDLNPEATQVATQVGLDDGAASAADAEGLAEDEVTVEEAAAQEPEPADDVFSAEPHDDAFELPETSFSDLDDAFSEFGSDGSTEVEIDLEVPDEFELELELEDDGDDALPEVELSFDEPESDSSESADEGAADLSFEDESEVFVLDLEDDEIPESMVQPPPDVGDESGTSFDTLFGAGDEPEAPVDAVADAVAEDVAEDVDEFEFDVEFEVTPEPVDSSGDFGDDTLAVQEAAESIDSGFAIEPPDSFEIDWSADAMSDLEVPAPEDEEPVLAETPEQAPEIDLEVGEFEVDFDEVADAAADAAADDAVEFEDVDAAGDGVAEDLAEEPVEAADDAPAAVRREEDLVAEAKVFAKYGLREKALDRLDELFESYPEHLEGLALRIRLDLEGGRHDEVVTRAAQLSQASRSQSESEPWATVRQELLDAGFGVDGDSVLSGPGEKPVAISGEDDRIAQLLEDLSLESFEDSASSLDETAFDSLLEDSSPPPAPPAAAAPPPAPPEAPPANDEVQLISLVDELGLDELDDTEDYGEATIAAAPTPPAPPVEAPPPDSLDETGMSWLDDAPPAETPAASSDAIFDEEDDFFDLAAELEAELGSDAASIDLGGVSSSMEPQEQSLEEIIEGFKQGVAENLSAEDYDTHFNLGIAYREMGLMDEAIGEFQLASKDPRYLVESASMLGICFLEKGLPELAVRWYRKALEAPGVTEDATLGLLYDMGNAYVAMGDPDAAYRTFVEIYGMNTNFRDVSVRMQELAPQQT
ncbi:MAG: tetratricopeptide repeat protein [Acidobacteriota bacterium]